jgi:hypothetical protein
MLKSTLSSLHISNSRNSSSLVETMNGIKIPSSSPAVTTRHSMKPKKKSVRFSELCKVVLIPMRQEYSAAGIFLWWTKKDFLSFRQMYITERQHERAAAALSTVPPAQPSPPPSGPSSLSVITSIPSKNTILIVTDQQKSEQLMSQISSVMTTQPSFFIATHEEVTQMPSGMRFDAVIVDGTEDCSCFELNTQCPQHSINRLSTINVIRSLSLSSNITLFVNDATINKQSILQLCSNADITTSDLMILTPDSWAEFQLLVESATSEKQRIDSRSSSSVTSAAV